MAYFWEEEEEEDLSDLGALISTAKADLGTQSDSDTQSLLASARGGQGAVSPWDVGAATFKGAYGNFLDKYAPHIFGDVIPQDVQDWGAKMDAEAEEVRQGYRSEYAQYDNDITKVPWGEIPGFISEKVQENGYLMSLQAGGAWLSGKMMQSRDVKVKAIGTFLAAITVAGPTPVIIDEVMNKHAEELGIPVEQMTDSQITNGIITGLENTALEALVPLALMRGVQLPNIRTTKGLFKHLTTTQKHTFAKQLMDTIKYAGKGALSEGATEMLETINAQRTSVAGLGGLDKGEVITSAVVGTAAGAPMSTPSAISQGRAYNKFRRRSADFINRKDRTAKLKAGLEYEKQFNELAASADGDFSPILDEIKPELYNLPETPKGFLGNLGGFTADRLLNRATNPFQSMFEKSKTGDDVDLVRRRLFGKFGDVESGSGEDQMGTSFNARKNTLAGKYTREFNKIKSKWSEHYYLVGEIGADVKLPIDNYVNLVMQRKSKEATRDKDYERKIAEARSELNLNSKDITALDNDIVTLRKIHDDVLIDLNKALDESGAETVGYTEGYITRGIDTEAVKKNKEEFIASLVNDVNVYPKGIPEKEATYQDRVDEANRIYNDILNGKDPSVMSSEQIRAATQKRSGVSKPGFEEHRDHRWDALNEKFRKSSAFDSMQDYLTRVATRTASAEVFGGNRANKLNEAINEALDRELMNNDEAQYVWDMYDAEHNIYKRPRNEKERAFQTASKVATTITAISYLGLAPISSITEPAWISGRVGTANMIKALPIVAGYVLRGMMVSVYGGKAGTARTKSFGKELLNVMGMAINPAINERIDKLMAGDSNRVLSMYFRTPGGLFLTQYTNFVRVWTAAAGLKMIQDQANKLSGMKGHKLSALKRELRENGMSLADFRQMVRAGNGKIDILNDEFLDKRFTKENGTEVSVRDLLVPWLRKITTDVALEPTVGNRPLWMSDPRMQLLSQLKSFPILFGNTIMKRTHRQLVRNNQCSPGMVGALGGLGSAATAIALGALAMAIKDEIKGNEDKEYGPIDFLSATGVPWVGSGSLVQMSSIPSLSVVDDFWSAFTDTPDIPIDMSKGMEHFLEFGTKATLGAIFAEQLGDD